MLLPSLRTDRVGCGGSRGQSVVAVFLVRKEVSPCGQAAITKCHKLAGL